MRCCSASVNHVPSKVLFSLFANSKLLTLASAKLRLTVAMASMLSGGEPNVGDAGVERHVQAPTMTSQK